MGKGSNSKIKSDLAVVIGVVALVINIITVLVYMYQAKIMQSQQRASAWPHVEWLLVFNEEQGLKLELRNNGIGPALIKQTKVTLNGETLLMHSLFVRLMGTDYFPHLTASINNRVLSPQNSIKPFQISDPMWAAKVYTELTSKKFEFSVCYESIYGDKWTTYGTEVVEGVCQ
jgi:hypothetical protein